MARKPSSVCATKPVAGVLANSVRVASASGSWRAPSQCQANSPTTTMAASLTSDSTAMASIMPWWCSVASTWRVPNSAANKAINSATYSAGSASRPVWPMSRPVSTPRLIATALYCRAR